MARKKVYKVKHYKTGYRRRRNNAFLKVFFLVLGCVAVFVLSYLLLGPLTDLIYNNTITSSNSSEVNSSISSNPNKTEDKSSLQQLKSRVITVDELINKEGHSALVASIKNDGYKAVVLPLRTKDNIFFSTQNEFAIRTGTITDVGVSELIKSLKTEKIKVYGEFSVFMDDCLPRVVYGSENIKMAVRFKSNLNYLAIDYLTDPKDKDGITWLSPESKETRDYITDLAKSAAETGVDGIIFTNYNYEVHTGAVFTDATGFNKSETLKAFTAELKEALKGTEIMISGTTEELKNGDLNKFGGKLSDISDDIIINADKCDEVLIESIKANEKKIFTLKLRECDEETLKKLKTQKNIKYVLVG